MTLLERIIEAQAEAAEAAHEAPELCPWCGQEHAWDLGSRAAIDEVLPSYDETRGLRGEWFWLPDWTTLAR